MNIKLSEILENAENIRLLQELKLPIKVSYRIKRLVDKISPIFNTYNDNRESLIKELGEEDPKTKIFSVTKLNEKEFFAKIKELKEVEEEVDYKPIKISELGEMNIEPKLLISFIFEE